MKFKFRYQMINGKTGEIVVAKSSFTLGRSKKNDLCIKGEGVSRKHCKFEVNREGELFITDLNSTNGVFIEGSRITPGIPVKYPLFLSLTIGPILNLDITQAEDDDRENIGLKSILKDSNSNLIPEEEKKIFAINTWHSRENKKQNHYWIVALFIFLMACILYLFFSAKLEVDFSLPNSPKSLNF